MSNGLFGDRGCLDRVAYTMYHSVLNLLFQTTGFCIFIDHFTKFQELSSQVLEFRDIDLWLVQKFPHTGSTAIMNLNSFVDFGAI